MIYLDNASTTFSCKEARKAIFDGIFRFGNPSSLHKVGLEAEMMVSKAREIISDAIGCSDKEIYFTSGATESNNTAIFGAYKAHGKRKNTLVTTSVEHPSVANPCNELENLGVNVVRVSPTENGEILAQDIFDAVTDDTFLVSCQLINNEIGYILPIEQAFSMIKRKYPNTICHCDCVQGFMKLPIKVKKLNADVITMSAHKIHAIKGAGAIYVKNGVHIPPFIVGGGQEKGFRGGTESVPLIAGFGASVEKLKNEIAENYKYAKDLQDYLLKKCSENEDIVVNSKGKISPYITSIAVKNLKSEVLLHYLEDEDVYISTGSACSKGKKSRVLQEFRVPNEYIDCTIRVSTSMETTFEEIDCLINGIKHAQQKLAKIK